MTRTEHLSHSRLLLIMGSPWRFCCCFCVLSNKADGNRVTFRVIIQAAGAEDGLQSGSRETH